MGQADLAGTGTRRKYPREFRDRRRREVAFPSSAGMTASLFGCNNPICSELHVCVSKRTQLVGSKLREMPGVLLPICRGRR